MATKKPISKLSISRIGPRTKKFRQTVTIKQVGARPIKTKRGTVFQLGGGVFSKRQIIASRQRYTRIKAPRIKGIKKSAFGL